MQLRIFGCLTALCLLGGCGVDVAVTTGHVAEMEATAAKEAQKQKEIALERLEEATRLMEQQRRGMIDAAGEN